MKIHELITAIVDLDAQVIRLKEERDDFEYALERIITIGINIITPKDPNDSFIWKPTSVEEGSNKKIDQEELISLLIGNMENSIKLDINRVHEIFYDKIKWMKGKKVSISCDQKTFNYLNIKDFSSDGSLIKLYDEKNNKLEYSTASIKEIL